MQKQKKEKNRFIGWKVSLLLITIVGFVIIIYATIEIGYRSKDLALTGDAIGGITGSLFGLVSIGLLYLALRQQSIEVEESNTRLRNQIDDNIFFNLINIHQGLIGDFDINVSKEKTHKGKDCFKHIYQYIEKGNYSTSKEKYNIIIDKYDNEIPTYKNNANTILSFISNSNNKNRYLEYFLGTMNKYEREIFNLIYSQDLNDDYIEFEKQILEN